MSRRKSYTLPSQLTIEEALDILDVDKPRGRMAYVYERRGAIMLLRKKLNKPPRLRFSYYEEHENNNGYKKWTNTKNASVETLQSTILKEMFNKRYSTLLRLVIRDRWKDNRLVYDGNNYDEFMEVVKNYAL